MARKKDISELKPSYLHRLQTNAAKQGLTFEQLRADKEALRESRGHKNTPERLSQAASFWRKRGTTPEEARARKQAEQAAKQAAKQAAREARQAERTKQRAERQSARLASKGIKSSSYLKNNPTKQQHGLTSLKDAQMPTSEQAERLAPPSPSRALEALKQTSSPWVAVAVLMRMDTEAGPAVRWLATVMERHRIESLLQSMRPGWQSLSYAERHALMVRVIVEAYFSELLIAEATHYSTGLVDRVLGFSFADAKEPSGE